jgi:hypothetical protein
MALRPSRKKGRGSSSEGPGPLWLRIDPSHQYGCISFPSFANSQADQACNLGIEEKEVIFPIDYSARGYIPLVVSGPTPPSALAAQSCPRRGRERSEGQIDRDGSSSKKSRHSIRSEPARVMKEARKPSSIARHSSSRYGDRRLMFHSITQLIDSATMPFPSKRAKS